MTTHEPSEIKVFTGQHTRRRLQLHFNSLPVCCALALAFAAGCTPSAQVPGQRQVQTQTLDVAGPPPPDLAAPSSGAEENPADSQRLEQLRLSRAHDAFSPDFSIGPGDILRVSVPGVDELKDYEVRVSADNTITLPVTDEIHIAGLSQEGVRQAIRHALERYVKDPDVEVFVKEYQSRQVAIIGMVQKPGLYTLTSRTDSVLDMVSRAGGMTESAGNNVILVPASADRGPSNARLFETAAFEVTQSAALTQSVAVTQSAAVTDDHYADASLTEKPDRSRRLRPAAADLPRRYLFHRSRRHIRSQSAWAMPMRPSLFRRAQAT